ncbi:RcpC/CpaB family pilus assembly protein [Streptomyces sp. JJ36]|uniref:RcpC/CpaB family pilus assembly protein n=1 Tax=Streptomyces sp. JJ36 TaxID=2736645 RepID=UPI001F45AB00|nr:RcpC/CpaB family pilus assembly protein [Streptomyces sp. JJ36]MCF6522312.1 hypothetical protein [Streptomyces sp. JJ36]
MSQDSLVGARRGAATPRTAGAVVPPEGTVPRTPVPGFPPIRAGGGRLRLRPPRALRGHRRAGALCLAMAAAACGVTALSVPGETGPDATAAARARASGGGGGGPDGGTDGSTKRGAEGVPPGAAAPGAEQVAAPVRIADAAAVRLLRPGDRVDVVAGSAGDAGHASSGAARVLARGARVAEVPEPGGGTAAGAHGPAGPAYGGPAGHAEAVAGAGSGGALVVLRVPRKTARELVGAAASGTPLGVALC